VARSCRRGREGHVQRGPEIGRRKQIERHQSCPRSDPTLGLKEAKDLVDGAPKTVKENVKKDEAAEIKKKIEEAGGTASVE
jgi:hypothetical protein